MFGARESRSPKPLCVCFLITENWPDHIFDIFSKYTSCACIAWARQGWYNHSLAPLVLSSDLQVRAVRGHPLRLHFAACRAVRKGALSECQPYAQRMHHLASAVSGTWPRDGGPRPHGSLPTGASGRDALVLRSTGFRLILAGTRRHVLVSPSVFGSGYLIGLVFQIPSRVPQRRHGRSHHEAHRDRPRRDLQRQSICKREA